MSQPRRAGLPNERSVFEHRTLQDIYDEIRTVYRDYPQPWVLGYSGGKDSTATLQLVWNALRGLPPAERRKRVFVIGSDTRVETPVVVEHLSQTLRSINEA